MKKYIFPLLALPLALCAATDDTAVANRKWVREALRKFAVESQTVKEDDTLHIEGGRCYVNVLEERDGIVTNVPYYFTTSVETTYGDKAGAIVISSDNPAVPRGTLLGKSGEARYVNTTKKVTRSLNGRTADLGYLLDLTINIEPKLNTSTPFTNMFFTAETIDAGWASRKITSEKSHSGSWIKVTDTITVNGNSEVYHYYIDGLFIFEDEHKTLCGSLSTAHTIDAWIMRSGHKSTRDNLVFIQDALSSCKRPFSLLSLFVPTAYAGEQKRIISPVPLLPYPLVDLVDTFNYAPDGVTKETHWPLPKEYVPSREQWYDKDRWFQDYPDHLPFVVTVEITLDSGRVITKPTRINSIKQLESLGVVIIKRDWPGVKFVKKAEMCEYGHIYGKNCECIVCGTKREHDFGFANVGENQCARCENQYDDWEENIWGELRPNGKKLDTICGAKTEDGLIELHRGWYATPHESDTTYYCDCECGYYHEKEPLRHLVTIEEGEKLDWQDKGDGIHHFVMRPCERGCGGEVEIKGEHFLDIDKELPDNRERLSRPVEGEQYAFAHLIDAACEDCTFVGEIQEHHRFDKTSCYCETCRMTIHDYEPVPCGPFENYICTRCGVENTEEDPVHQYGYILTAEDEEYGKVSTHHRCFCGKGELDPHRFKNGECTVCGYGEKKKGVSCASKKLGPKKGPANGAANDSSLHTGDRSATGGFYCTTETDGTGAGACEDCGGSFFNDYPEAIKYVDAPGAWSMRIRGGVDDFSWKASDARFSKTLETVSSLEGIISTYRKNIGATVEINIKWNPKTLTTVKIENFSFLPSPAVSVYGETWNNSATYSGTVVNHPDLGMVIEW